MLKKIAVTEIGGSKPLLKSRPVISIRGARANNLQNLDLDIPKNALIVVSGVSGSGKSSLAIDTLYAEGQRRYVESLSSYARQFMSRMKKPEVDTIKGISPAIAVDQKVSSANARSTVGSLTEINEYLRLLFARIGKTYSPVSGMEVKKHEVNDVILFIQSIDIGKKCMVLAPLPRLYPERTLGAELNLLNQKGYTRLWHNQQTVYIEDMINENPDLMLRSSSDLGKEEISIIIDRFVANEDSKQPEFLQRLADSIKTAFEESHGYCAIQADNETYHFSGIFEADGLVFPEPEPNLFNPNNSLGACTVCEGYGKTIGIAPEKIIPDPSLSVYEGAVAPWKVDSGFFWKDSFIKYAPKADFPIHRSYEHLNSEELNLLWNGNKDIEGINQYIAYMEQNSYKLQYRVALSRYRGKTICSACNGKRLKSEALNVKVGGMDITQFYKMPVNEMKNVIETIKISEFQKKVAERLLTELRTRLFIMDKIGLGYLSMERPASTLSGGEVQRINLTRTLSSNLTASLYILDEPSIGLHARDTNKLIDVLFQLRDLGNTVVLVEHDEDIIRRADHLIDIGPEAGIHGGQIVYQGNFRLANPIEHPNSLTIKYLHHLDEIPVKTRRRKAINHLNIYGAKANNLKGFDVRIPLQAITVVSGVSGSGKSTLINEVLVQGINQILGGSKKAHGTGFKEMTGDFAQISMLEYISQNPMGKSSRSNPVTYVKAFDYIRDVYTRQPLSKLRGYAPKHFSFNVEGGRCESCKGEGETVVEMQFLADVSLTCEDCHGRRFKKDILEVEYNGKNIFDVLNLSIEEAITFFKAHKDITERIKPLHDVGLDYLKLGQSSSTLSGGEAQRVKLASYLGKSQQERILFIFDEPTTGLHLHDIKKLLYAFEALVEKGHTVIIVEHHLDVIKNADYLIDLGPEAGFDGGHLLYQGIPEGLLEINESHTAKYLKEKLQSN
jgi:excinuclease ABC subunit A